MSFFLLSDRQLYSNIVPKGQYPQASSLEFDVIAENALLACKLEGQIKKMGEVCATLKKQDKEAIEYHYLSRFIHKGYNMVHCLKLNKQKRSIEMNVIFTLPQGIFFRIQNISNYVHIINQLTVRPEAHQIRLVNMSLNLNNGLLIARLPALNLFNHFIETSTNQIQTKMLKLFRYQIQQSLPLFEKILGGNKIQNHHFSESFEKDMTWASIYRYNEMINITSHLNESYLASEAQIRHNNKLKRNDIKLIIKNRKAVQNSILKNNLLLQEHRFITNGIPQDEVEFQLTRQEQGFAHFIIAMPQNQKSLNPLENNMILNFIHIKDNMNNLQINKSNQGGFASLYLTEVKFAYVYSSQGEQQVKKNKNYENIQLKKIVMAKKSTTRQQQHRIKHQISILKEIKNGAAIFLPKYYLPINQGCFFTDAILMDYIPFKNLKEYLQSNSVTMSLMAKIFLIFSITQSLRYIRDYQIVHLDLKSANIMIYFNLVIKLIDFGESYHPIICEQKHTPGYTMPYSPPEVYAQTQDLFTSKSDVYSLGIIIHEILYNRLPFPSSPNTQTNDKIMENYLNRWYFMPQQLEARGQTKILRLLNMLVSKCLRPRAKDRPELDWIALIIRQCLELIH